MEGKGLNKLESCCVGCHRTRKGTLNTGGGKQALSKMWLQGSFQLRGFEFLLPDSRILEVSVSSLKRKHRGHGSGKESRRAARLKEHSSGGTQALFNYALDCDTPLLKFSLHVPFLSK